MRGSDVNNHTEWSEGDRAAIADELERLLADPAFKGSKRCQSLLRRLVEQALAGNQESLKERSLGIEVFGRDANYDTSTDPVVRIAANEIRKRLGQCYQETESHRIVRIRLIAGSYLPKFDFDHLEQPLGTIEAAFPEEPHGTLPPDQTHVPQVEMAHPSASIGFRRKWILWSVAVLLVIAAVFGTVHYNDIRSADYVVWKPLLDSDAPLTVCISDTTSLVNAEVKGNSQWQIIANVIADREIPSSASPANPTPTTSLDDVEVANRIAVRMAKYGKQSSLRPSSTVNLSDLRQGPVVLIGGFNPWSLILLSDLRYSVRVDPTTHDKWIQDSQNPSKRDWKVNANTDQRDIDFAIISRFLDLETGQWIFALGGLWPYGTVAASNLLTDPSFARMLPSDLSSKKNFQIVLKTDVINGNAGPPQILAVHTW
jgi:hypothetical protein